jgi:hypothetical protein
LRQQRIRSCEAEPVAINWPLDEGVAEPKNPMVLCTFQLWSLAASADHGRAVAFQNPSKSCHGRRRVKTPSKRYAPGVLLPHLGFYG